MNRFSPAAMWMLTMCMAMVPAAAAGDPQQPEARQAGPSPTLSRTEPPPISFFATAATAADTNIDHNSENVHAYGLAVGAGVRYQSEAADPPLLVTYQAALHRYAGTDRWNRLSHNVRAVFEHELEGPWEVHAIGEVSLKGTSEDRELSNQYIATPRIQYRIDRWRRVRGYATLRLRRYDIDTGRNATNRYAGVEFTQRSDAGDQWDVELRLERNEAREQRNTYKRWTFGTQYTTPVTSRDSIVSEIRFRHQKYVSRLVEVDDTDVPRRDLRWVPSIYWLRKMNSHAEMRIGYEMESRASNDLGRDFTAHLFIAAATHRW